MKRPAMQWTCDVCGKPGGVSADRPVGWVVGPAEVPEVCDDCVAGPGAEICNAAERARKRKGKGKKADEEPPH